MYDIQSLSHQLSKPHIVLPPGQHQVIVNPQSGKRERIFVDLQTVYPTPEEPGSELSFEEVWAMNRGWLDWKWEDEEDLQDAHAEDGELSSQVDLLTESLSQKLVVHQDVVMLDENGAPILPREGKPKKKKVIEVNETQISEFRAAIGALHVVDTRF